jgi:tripartite-type tricarboxylate transporter receptor subunit TctC
MNSTFGPKLARVVGALCLMAGFGAHAQDKVVKMIVPFPPAGVVDIVGRVISNPLSAALGKNVVVENKPGASGNVGMGSAAGAPADGGTIVLNTLPLVTSKAMYGNLSYDLQKDFKAVAIIATAPYVFVVNSSMPVNDLKGFLELARSKPGEISYGSAGSGSTLHLATELLQHMAKVNLQHVPYKGGGPAVADTIGGHVQMTVPTTATAASYIANGQLKALGVTAKKRVAGLGNVPTVHEAGVPGYEFSSWVAVLVPAKTPPAVINQLYDALVKVMASKNVIDQLAKNGFEPMVMGPSEAGKFLLSEETRWGALIKTAGIKP